MTKEIPVPLRSNEPEPVQERGQVGQPFQGEKERMQEYQPEGGYAEPFMHLVNLVQAVKISFQQPVADRLRSLALALPGQVARLYDSSTGFPGG